MLRYWETAVNKTSKNPGYVSVEKRYTINILDK